MSLQITNHGGYIKLTSTLDATLDEVLYKNKITRISSVQPDDLMDDTDDRVLIEMVDSNGKDSYELIYNTISLPSSTDIDDLVNTLLGYITSPDTAAFYDLPDAAIQVTASTTSATLQALLAAEDATLTAAELVNINYIELNSEGAIRYQADATPTTSTGMKLAADETRIIEGVNPANLNIIAESGTVNINVQIGIK